MSSPYAITCHEVSKTYRSVAALDQVSMTVRSGECVALVGPNGAGKSTLFKLCLGLVPASSGDLGILGCDPKETRFNHIKRRLGFLPEQAQFQASLNAHETLRFFARLKGADERQNTNLLERVQLSEAAGRRVSTYSKGMRQRLGLAQALIGRPDLLLLDEPMSGLDPDARRNFFQIIDEEKARGAAIILSSHILTELEARTDRVAILSQGQLKAHGTIRDLRKDLNLHPQIRLHANASQMQKLAKHFSGRFDQTSFMNGAAVLDCAPGEKLELLRELMSDHLEFEALDIIEPSLEQIFAAHTSSGVAG